MEKNKNKNEEIENLMEIIRRLISIIGNKQNEKKRNMFSK